MQQYKTEQTPERFVEKARMNANHICAFADHSPGKICGCTESFLICKIAPSSYSLSEQKTNHCNIKNRKNLHFLNFGNCKTACKRTDYSAVNCETSVIYVENLNRIFAVIIPLEKAEIQPCADYTRNYSYKYAVYKLVKIHIISWTAPPCI